MAHHGSHEQKVWQYPRSHKAYDSFLRNLWEFDFLPITPLGSQRNPQTASQALEAGPDDSKEDAQKALQWQSHSRAGMKASNKTNAKQVHNKLALTII